jgi:hypothetical protein
MADTDQEKTGDGQGQEGAGDGSGQGGQGDGKGSQPPATQAKGVTLKLTQEQVGRLLKDGTLEIEDSIFTGAVQERIGQLTARARTAERRLSEIAAAQEETERKALEEQEKYKDLYEKERVAREKEATARRGDVIRSQFLVAATKAGVIDTDAAFVIAQSLPGYASVAMDDEGRVTGVDDLVKALVEQKPYLVSTQPNPKQQTVGSVSNPNQQEPPAPKTLAEAGDRLEQALKTGTL